MQLKKILVPMFLAAATASSAFASSSSATAKNMPVQNADCTVLRAAKAWFTITKNSWSQQNGIWVQSGTELARVNADVPVVVDNGAGCSFPTVLKLDNIQLNGQSQTVAFNAHINMETTNLRPKPNKVFVGSYYVSSDNGRGSYASAWTPDQTTPVMGLSFAKERTADTNTAHEETLNIGVWFDDSQAQ
jgi:hypothetical protein